MSETQTSGLLDRAWDRVVSSLWQARRPEGGRAGPARATSRDRLRERIEACLSVKGGEVSARREAVELGRTYLALDLEGRHRFLRLLADDYGVDRDRLADAVAALGEAGDEAGRLAAQRRLRGALNAPRMDLLTRFNGLPQGVKFLVDLRSDLLAIRRETPNLSDLDDDLKGLLASWFDVGLLTLRQITWDSPAALLEKLIAYEAVHEIRSWSDLKNRLDSDRRCFAFFHPNMPDEPLIFVEVALVNGIAGNVHELLDEEAPNILPEQADTAIFYSISNAQDGLAGVSFGNFLIKMVADRLQRDLPGLKTFATLSPIPGFSRWMEAAMSSGTLPQLRPDEAVRLCALADAGEPLAALRTLLARPDWCRDEDVALGLEPILMRLAAHYLVKEKRGQGALDRVAGFHLGNGARLERLNWAADLTPNGLRQSAGMMVNYLYRLGEVEKNHEAYAGTGRIAMSSAVRRLLRD